MKRTVRKKVLYDPLLKKGHAHEDKKKSHKFYGEKCPQCKGRGVIQNDPCGKCEGTGYL